MTISYRLLFLCSLISTLGLMSTLPNLKSAKAAVVGCPTPALSRFRRHKVVRGETLVNIAESYHLTPTTIINMNPSVNNGTVSIGSLLDIPPYNGMVVEVPRGQTWRQIAAQYKVHPDTLFEINGCQKNPRIVFVPTSNRSFKLDSNQSSALEASSIKTSGYPLSQAANVLLAYGWKTNATTGEVFFHSGVDLSAEVGTSVQAIAPGVVVFAKDQNTYGNLIIINHSGGLQSRYAQLDSINVRVGQQVEKGDILGTVGITGQPSSAKPHLHFEMRSSSPQGWVAEDPSSYLHK